MKQAGFVVPKAGLESLGLQNLGSVRWNLSVPALYEEAIRRGEGRVADGGAFVVNLDTRESILTPAASADLQKAFGNHPFRVMHSRPSDLASWRPGQEDEHSEHNMDYWPWLLLAAVILFAAETLLANFFTRRKRTAPPPEIEYMGAEATRRSLAGAGVGAGAGERN